MTRKWSSLLLSGGLLALMTTSCPLVRLVLWQSLPPSPTPKVRDFELTDLLIDAFTLPLSCRFDGPVKRLYYEDSPRDAQDGWYILFGCSTPEARGGQAVYRFRDPETAAKRCRDSPGFSNANRVTPYETPDWLQYESPVADQFRFACADFYGGYPKGQSTECVALGQYEEYISVFFFGTYSLESMVDHAAELEQMLRSIDDRMNRYLSQETSMWETPFRSFVPATKDLSRFGVGNGAATVCCHSGAPWVDARTSQ